MNGHYSFQTNLSDIFIGVKFVKNKIKIKYTL
nr:MAG TPA: hypothetical protein [Caudoviricetes sp.]